MVDTKTSSDNAAKHNFGDHNTKPPSVSLPKGGGAIRGIGEKFAANPVTGTGSINVPIYTSPGRSGFGPQLSLSYDSGHENGAFGLGWNLSLPSVTRKTDKGLPQYQEDSESEKDVFILSGIEDLVPVMIKVSGEWRRHSIVRAVGGISYRINRYRPRIEGLFARIECWTNTQSGETHWRSISKDNVTALYGKTAESRIAHPEDPRRIFSWLICESYDDKGNAMLYEYKAENSQKVNRLLVQELNRTDKMRATNRYIKRIKYGNRRPHQLSEDPTRISDWMFEVVFDYGENYTENDQGHPISVFVRDDDNNRQWQVREDPLSSYRAGFEIRTYRLCRHVLMFHHFQDELGVQDYLVRSTSFKYRESPTVSFITSIIESGYILRRSNGTYLKKPLPPLDFEYSQASVKEEIKYVDATSLENLPSGLDGKQYMWADLDGEGLSGILTQQGGVWLYKRNFSSLPVLEADGKSAIVARFAPAEVVSSIPSIADLDSGLQMFMDLAGDGNLDLVQVNEPISGYYERSSDNKWESFVPFASIPNISLMNPNLRFVDLTGDGHTDILVTENEIFFWYASLAEAGFGPGQRICQALDEERGPKLVFADRTQSIYLADMSGDGLTDLVRIRNGEICYWPNLGYGSFGAKVTMGSPPWFDNPDQFDQQRIRLADIDGSGVTDIIYLRADGVHLYFNQSGNSWSNSHPLTSFPAIDNLSSVMVVDLLGNGTACLVWSSSLPSDSRRNMRYVDLMGGHKPHLLVLMKNNMGMETIVHYAPSTKFYLTDKIAGKSWITKLPFPVHLVEHVETYDRISRNRFVTRYAYHHGYFDGEEREFRGFALVEQWDTEEYAALSTSEAFSSATNIDSASHVPPVLTKTWFHTGSYLIGDRISRQFESEYYRETGLTDVQFQAQLLDDTILPTELTTREEQEACRALKGSMLRQEIYAMDNSPESRHPYFVSERNYEIKLIQPQAGNLHALFHSHPRESIEYHYERNPLDPRVNHTLTLAVDSFGNILRSVSIGYGRRKPDLTISEQEQTKQTKTLITYTDNRFTNPIDLADIYRAPMPCETLVYELTGLSRGINSRFDFATLDYAVVAAILLQYEVSPSTSLEKRLIDHVRTLYRKDDLTGPLPMGQMESLALPFESYRACIYTWSSHSGLWQPSY